MTYSYVIFFFFICEKEEDKQFDYKQLETYFRIWFKKKQKKSKLKCVELEDMF